MFKKFSANEFSTTYPRMIEMLVRFNLVIKDCLGEINCVWITFCKKVSQLQ